MQDEQVANTGAGAYWLGGVATFAAMAGGLFLGQTFGYAYVIVAAIALFVGYQFGRSRPH